LTLKEKPPYGCGLAAPLILQTPFATQIKVKLYSP